MASSLAAGIVLAFVLFSSLASAQCADLASAVRVSDFQLASASIEAGGVYDGSVTVMDGLSAPMPGLSVTMRLVRNVDGGGQQVVGEFDAAKWLNLSPNLPVQVPFKLAMPRGMPAGSYSLLALVHSANFNPRMLPAGSLDLTASNANAPDYPLVAIESSNSTSLLFNVTNFGAAANVSVQYRLYYMGRDRHVMLEGLSEKGLLPGASPLLDSFSAAQRVFGWETVEMGEGGQKQFLVDIGTLPPGSYVLEISALKESGMTTSLIPMQVEGAQAAIEFASLSPLPLDAGFPASISACISVQGGQAAILNATLLSDSKLQNAVYQGTAEVAGAPEQNVLLDFVPEAAGGTSLLLSLASPGGNVLDALEADYPAELFAKPATLGLQSALSDTNVAYSVTLADAQGSSIAGNVEVVLKNAEGNVVDTQVLAVNGTMEGSFQAPAGGYVLEASESALGLRATSANSTPYELETQFEVPPPAPEPEQQALISNPFALLGIAVLLVLLVGLGIFAMKYLGGGKRKEFDSEWDKI